MANPRFCSKITRLAFKSPGFATETSLDARTMEPQNTRNALMAAVPYWVRTKRLISSRGLPKLSSKQRCKPEAFK